MKAMFLFQVKQTRIGLIKTDDRCYIYDTILSLKSLSVYTVHPLDDIRDITLAQKRSVFNTEK